MKRLLGKSYRDAKRRFETECNYNVHFKNENFNTVYLL